MKEARWAQDEEGQVFLREAEELLQGTSAKSDK
jgi:hypothetical protein